MRERPAGDPARPLAPAGPGGHRDRSWDAGRGDPDVLVVGGGPAGSAVALLLARAGVDVAVIDRARFPRAKPCGECLNPGAVAALGRLGLLDAVLALAPARLTGWDVGGSVVSVGADFGAGLGALAVPRLQLDATLLAEAEAAGARVAEGVRLEQVYPAGNRGRPHAELRDRVRGPVAVRPRVVIGADGLRSRVARSLGLALRPRGRRRISFTFRLRRPGPGGPTRGRLTVRAGSTLGLVPVHAAGESWNATLVTEGAARVRAVAADPVLALHSRMRADDPSEPDPDVVAGPWVTGPFHRPVRAAWAPGAALVGDAAGYYDPFTGQGIYRALRSAELVAPAVLQVLASGSHAPLRDYAAQLEGEVAGPRRLQRAVDAIFRAAWTREPALAALGLTRSLAPVVRRLGDATGLPPTPGDEERSVAHRR